MDKVIQFPVKEEELVWQCNCGSVAFSMFYSGEIKCVRCGVIVEEMGCWLKAE